MKETILLSDEMMDELNKIENSVERFRKATYMKMELNNLDWNPETGADKKVLENNRIQPPIPFYLCEIECEKLKITYGDLEEGNAVWL